MTPRDVARLGDPILRERAELVNFSQETALVKRIVTDMVETMREANGVGISAPQIHEGKRVIAIEVRAGNRYGVSELIDLQVIVNPEVEATSARKALTWEGCLSLPGLRGPVERHQDVVVRGVNPSGADVECEFVDFGAVVVQHEIDHIDGILFVDRMKDLRLLSFEDEYRRHQLHQDSEVSGPPSTDDNVAG